MYKIKFYTLYLMMNIKKKKKMGSLAVECRFGHMNSTYLNKIDFEMKFVPFTLKFIE